MSLRSICTRLPLVFRSSFICQSSILLLICAFLFFYRLADRDLWSSHEGRAAQNAQSVINDGSLAVPQLFDKRVELQKPPLYYWMVAVVAQLREGHVDAWAVRLPAALSAALALAGVYLFGVGLGRPVAGFVAAVVLATGVHFTTLARTGRIDMPLTLAIEIALGSYFLGRESLKSSKPRYAWMWFALGYLGTAFAILLKGPIGIALPAAVVGAHLLVSRELPLPWRGREWGRLAHEIGLWWGLPLVAALVLPWFVWANAQTNGSFLSSFFWYHNVERALGGTDNMHPRPWYLYGVYLTTHFLPWSVLLPLALWYCWRNRDDTAARFGAVWLLGMVFMLSFVRFKRADYLLPAFPGAALLIGCAAEGWLRKSLSPQRLKCALGAAAGLCIVGWFVYLQFILPSQDTSREYHRFAAEIRKIVPAPELVLFFRAEEHALAFHLGPELDTFLEWENLDVWAGRPGCHYIVMPAACADQWPQHISAGGLVEIMRSTDFGGARRRPLVLMRTKPHSP